MDNILSFPQNEKYELELLYKKDDFKSITIYITQYIDKVLKEFKVNDKDGLIRKNLIKDIRIAAESFVKNYNNRKPDYKFSAYYSWYLQKRINM